MKNLILLSSLFFVTFSLHAQVDSTSCSTIVLENDKEISAYIHDIKSGYLFYQRCPDSTSHRYSIPLEYIKFINDSRGFQDSLASQIATSPELGHLKSKKQQLKKWVFKSNNRGLFTNTLERSVKEKQRVKVRYKDSGYKMRKVKGRWNTLTEEDLILDMRKGTTLMIPRDDIVKIDIIKSNILLKVLGILFGFVGILLLFGFFLYRGLEVEYLTDMLYQC